MGDIVIRFLIGGLVVSAFSLVGAVLKPKSFAGLFGAAPSVALATLALTVMKDGKGYAALEARSMIAGAAALFVYCVVVTVMLKRTRLHTLSTTLSCAIVWFGTAFVLWYALLR